MRNLTFLIFVLLASASRPAKAIDIFVCQHLLNGEVQPFSIFDPKNSDHLPDPERRRLSLDCDEHHCLKYIESKDPFDTAPDAPNIPLSRRYYQRGPLVVTRNGGLIGEPVHRSEANHSHAQLTPDDRAYFAGHIATSASGQVLFLDYRANQTKQRPCTLKLLIDDLGGPQTMPNGVVHLSDIPIRGPLHAYLPHLPIADFYSLCSLNKDSGLDILLRYLAQPPEDFSKLDYREILEPAAVQVFRIVEETETLRRGIDMQSRRARFKLIEHLILWITKTWYHDDKSKYRLITAYQLMHPKEMRNRPISDFESEFYTALRFAIPEFRKFLDLQI